MAKAGVWAQREARRVQLDLVRQAQWPLAGLAAIVVALNVVFFWRYGGSARSFLMGAMNATAVWGIALLVVQASGSGPRTMGGQAERWTADELRKFRRAGWHALHSVPLFGCDADHVVIGPAGVFVLETKWSAQRWERGDERVERAADQAFRNARAVRSRLRAYAAAHPVRALVVLWGEYDELPDAAEEVVVLHGSALKPFLRDYTPTALTPEEVTAAVAGLRKYVQMRETHEAKTPVARYVEAGLSGLAGDVGQVLVAAVLGFVGALILVWGRFTFVIALPLSLELLGASLLLRRQRRIKWASTGVFAGACAATTLGVIIWSVHWVAG